MWRPLYAAAWRARGQRTDCMKDDEELSEAEVASQLVERIHQGEVNAEGELVARYSNGLLFMLQRTCGDPSLAEDLHQEAFRIVLTRLRSRGLEEPGGLSGYLRGTARNLLIADRRKQARRKTEADHDQVVATADTRQGQAHTVLRHEEASIVHRLIDEMPGERDRQLLYRFYIAEEEKEQICDDLGLTSLHFNRVLFRARQRFKDLWTRFERRQRLLQNP